MNIKVFGKYMENVRKHRNINFAINDKRKNYLVCEPNHYSTKWFSEKLVAIETREIHVKISKSVYLDL